MNIVVVGTGYVGLCTGVALAANGHRVACVDIDEGKIRQLQAGKVPIYEEGLASRVQQYRQTGHLWFTTDLRAAMTDNTVVFVTVGTPSAADGGCDLSAVRAVAEGLGRGMHGYTVVVIKSTVPVGTAERVEQWIRGQLKQRKVGIPFDVVSNPEFLREGQALRDALQPERIVVGCRSPRALAFMRQVYQGMSAPWLVTTSRNAEMIKYASNAFLACKVSFINELARLCTELGADIAEVAHGMGLDPRIGPHFLKAGIGYGGSCFPKDVRALLHTAREYGVELSIIERVQAVNDTQVDWFYHLVETRLGGLSGKQIGILGLTFKPHTDDLREAPSLRLIPFLLSEGVTVVAYDPMGAERVQKIYPDIKVATSVEQAAAGSNALILVTEWPQLLRADWQKVRHQMRGNWLFDARNALDRTHVEKAGLRYVGISHGDDRGLWAADV
ncbi:MAG: UDP-glucose/GDP-mannose dehydrogenase family protein [Alicyclobacillus herbarius]|uniref:UDP-glucose dehydrogenase family protein n=1 Tax=Alicyclobacillus herbarius TaxID=122960 RepID=UPI0023521F86|nr:UDP-glucose/GDP-mannose dehydrogenase family protein [Alicyclobacillus herbarius]MCL6632667.1 UDP-glucose/GDP-mannose dehydrogenase family protein [Alicyclobacillus herbarius]